MEIEYEHLKELKTFIPLPKKGEILLFGPTVVHSSLPNLSNNIRWSVDIRLK